MNNEYIPSEREDLLSAETDGVGGDRKSELSDPEALYQQLLELVDRACQHLPGSPQRNYYLTRLIRDIERSGKLWKENKPYYEDALHKTWIYLSRNLCEATTAKQPYDPTKSRITTWLNVYLQQRLKDEPRAKQKARQNTIAQPLLSLDERDNLDLTENLPATPDLTSYMEEILEWIETDPTGELKSNQALLTLWCIM
ncbi:sigma-70 family RNA polymerase sigma factor [Microcoleus sp. A003_D6]|uniref:sigma-70 family RNA polymerase sigma factor n=1 Tax=Microcoleus sp. A003_D6 TaxID=3055266 RepID=UPI002FCE76F5